jgi:hypothetical protein
VGIGFLPPDNTNQIGEGHVSYLVRGKPNLPTGLQISNIAYIQFDQNPAIATDLLNDNNPSQGVSTNKMAIVTIDSTPPISSVSSLPAIESATHFTVSWSGTDVGPGIVGYNIYVSTNSGPWIIWLAGTTNTSATFTGQNGNTYGFFSTAQDETGITEAPHLTADAMTTVQTNIIGSLQFLTIALSSNQIVLAWPGSLGNRLLQTTTNLGLAGTWIGVTNTAVLVGGYYSVNLPIRPLANYFRLSNPSLGIALSGQQMMLSWPQTPIAYQLQTTTNLFSPVNWNGVTNIPFVIGSSNFVVLSITNTVQFFRLQSP